MEVVDVSPRDLVGTPAGLMIRVQRGKGDKYRESPVLESLAATINGYADLREAGGAKPVVDRLEERPPRGVDDADNLLVITDLRTLTDGRRSPHTIRR